MTQKMGHWKWEVEEHYPILGHEKWHYSAAMIFLVEITKFVNKKNLGR